MRLLEEVILSLFLSLYTEVNIYQTTAYSSSKIDLTGSGFDGVSHIRYILMRNDLLERRRLLGKMKKQTVILVGRRSSPHCLHAGVLHHQGYQRKAGQPVNSVS
jgi:hypothetical protein